ncbi:family 16 glycosylhydrolase [Fluviicola sp.]|jgi:beta-glucanase (GH16 family)|uniref:family 16 glycosylhydrolase n=1 Tax=Fluviicola sp. TaxID=1917219 RepID=UPI0028350B7E|nr:family 16 glycosylhydrolase [Fluviicola sp.]MDR0803200.1 family 16 glycosylhydrolase [Fluviicola sp.]
MRTIFIFCLVLLPTIIAAQHLTCDPRHFFEHFLPLPHDPRCCQRNQVYLVGEPEPCNNQGWVLYFEDNFDENTLDLSKWRYPYQGILGGFSFKGWKNWYANTGTTPSKPISDNIKVENGSLKIMAKKENVPINGTYVADWATNPPTTGSSTFDYSSGWVESKKNFGYGWYEIRCKIPKGKGMWPAFWLFSGQDGYNFEIDIFEFWNENSCLGSYDSERLSKNPHQNLHSDKNPDGTEKTCSTEIYKSCSNWPSTGFDADFHVFALEWDYYKIVWYIDGQAIRTEYRFTNLLGQNLGCNSLSNPLLLAQYWPFTDNMYVLLNLGVQHDEGSEPDANTTFPKVFEIDYFRYYKRAPCAANVAISSKPQLNLSSLLYNTLMGQNVTVSGTVTINSNEQLEIVASNEIVLNPGFEAADDAEFVAHIDPGYCDITKMAVNNQISEAQQAEYFVGEVNETSLGVNEIISETEEIKLYPNPANDHLSIELPEVWRGVSSIKISDAWGRELVQYKQNNANEVIDLDIGYLSDGMYVLEVFNKESGKSCLKRFLKKD